MIKAEFLKITEKIGDAYRDPFTEEQFKVWLEQFKDEDFNVVDQASTLLIAEYKWFPMIATLREYIKRVKESKEAETKAGKKKALGEPTPQDFDRHKRWMRYIRWIVETKNYPKTPEEAMKGKLDFEEKYPDWRPKEKVEKKGPEPVGDILDEIFGKKEEKVK